MARNPPEQRRRKKQPAAVETSASIEEQTRLFLKSGNKIDFIQSGVSGQPTMAVNKQIKLGNKQKPALGARRLRLPVIITNDAAFPHHYAQAWLTEPAGIPLAWVPGRGSVVIQFQHGLCEGEGRHESTREL